MSLVITVVNVVTWERLACPQRGAMGDAKRLALMTWSKTVLTTSKVGDVEACCGHATARHWQSEAASN